MTEDLIDDLKYNLQRAVRAFRAYHGWTQEDLARKAGLSRSAVRDIERGRGNPMGSTIESLSKALGAPVHRLVGAWELRPTLTEDGP